MLTISHKMNTITKCTLLVLGALVGSVLAQADGDYLILNTCSTLYSPFFCFFYINFT
jgi:hypothetical protein